MNKFITTLSVLGLIAGVGGVSFAQTKPVNTLPVDTDKIKVSILKQETRREDAGGCVGSITYNHALAGKNKMTQFGERYSCLVADEKDTSKCVNFPYKTRISINVYAPGNCVNYVSILEGEQSQGARLVINGLFYDTDASAAQLVAPFVEAIRRQNRMMAFVIRGEEDRNNSATIGNIPTKSCSPYYDGTINTQGAQSRCPTGYELTHAE